MRGTPNLKFAWEIKAKQKDYEYLRLEEDSKEEKESNTAEDILIGETENYIKEQEEILWSNN